MSNNRTVLRGILFFIILATLPFYVLGLGIWATAPDKGAQARITQTVEVPAGNATWTPLGMNRTPSSSGFPTLGATSTSINPLLPTPIQFIPIGRTAIATAYVPPIDTLAPTLTPNNDSDRDGIPDNQDQCPALAGPSLFQGCPDTDNDGISDKTDACPGTGGVAAYNGCPAPTAAPVVDSDGDGVPNTTDQCPSQVGTAANFGCPAPVDTDNDGVLDSADQCINQAGPASNNGCPLPATSTPIVDTDGDGIPDGNDLCPLEQGTPLTQGCPEDTDLDGFNDNVDQCISTPGPNQGCP